MSQVVKPIELNGRSKIIDVRELIKWCVVGAGLFVGKKLFEKYRKRSLNPIEELGGEYYAVTHDHKLFAAMSNIYKHLKHYKGSTHVVHRLFEDINRLMRFNIALTEENYKPNDQFKKGVRKVYYRALDRRNKLVRFVSKNTSPGVESEIEEDLHDLAAILSDHLTNMSIHWGRADVLLSN